MLSHTLKSVIKHLTIADSKKKFEISGTSDGRDYLFTIYQGEVNVRITVGDLVNSFLVKDVEMLSLPENILIESWLDTVYMSNNEIFEQNMNNLTNDIALFLRLFKVLRERAIFTFHYNGKFYEATYIYGKAYFVEESEKDYTVRVSDLYMLFNKFPGYQIYTIDKTFDIGDSREYTSTHSDIAKKIGKTFRVEHHVRVKS
jgi:hypothetical protein